MTLEQILTALKETGLPVAYRAFPVGQAPEPPFICYLYSYSNNFEADNHVYQQIGHIQIELYTKNKDPQSETLVESALAGLCWEKTEEYLDDEQCYEILYEIEV